MIAGSNAQKGWELFLTRAQVTLGHAPVREVELRPNGHFQVQLGNEARKGLRASSVTKHEKLEREILISSQVHS